MAIDDGGYAFTSPADDKAGWYAESGMTLRDYFAGKALVAMGTWMPAYSNGMLASPETMAQRALLAYQQADAMIAARKAGGE